MNIFKRLWHHHKGRSADSAAAFEILHKVDEARERQRKAADARRKEELTLSCQEIMRRWMAEDGARPADMQFRNSRRW
jgi:hypothetical protein